MREPTGRQGPRPDYLGQGKKSKPFQLISFALRRGPLVLILGGLLSLALLPLSLTRVSQTYETSATLLIDPAKEQTIAGRERETIPGNIGEYTRTLVNRLTGYDILVEALGRLAPNEYPAFLGPPEPLERNVYRLMSRIKVREVPRTYLIAVSLTAEEPQGLGPVLNMVLTVFVEKIQREQEEQYARRLIYLTDERTKLLSRLAEEKRGLMALAESRGEMTILNQNNTVHLNRLELIQRHYWEAEAQRSEMVSLLEKAEREQREISRMDLQPFADERVADNFGINRIEQWTYEQLQSLRASIDGLTPTNPDRVYVEERMAAMTSFLDTYKKQVNQQTIINMAEKLAYELELAVVKSKSAYLAAQSNAEHLEAALHLAGDEASQTSAAIYRASQIVMAIGQLQERLAALNNRIDDAEMEAKAPVRLAIDKSAASPEQPARSNITVLLLAALALGFGGVFSFVLVFDLFDNRLRRPADVEQALGGPALAPIEEVFPRDLSAGENFAGLSLSRPDYPGLRVVRGLAVRLELAREQYQARVFALSGLNRRVGVTSLCLNLGHILRSGCTRVLVVECTFAHPGLTGLEPAVLANPGLGELLDGGGPEQWREVVQFDPRREIDLITAGSLASPLPRRDGLLGFLAWARQEYDVVLLDCAAVLSDEFAAFAAAHADATLLIGREDASLYRDLRRAIDLLLVMEVPALTALLNFTRPSRGKQLRLLLVREMQFISKLHQAVEKILPDPLRWLTGRWRR